MSDVCFRAVILGLVCAWFVGAGCADSAEWPGWMSSLRVTRAGQEGAQAEMWDGEGRHRGQEADSAGSGTLPCPAPHHCPALFHTSVLDGTFPVHFTLPTHISPFLNLLITTGTLSSSSLFIGINVVALIS